MKDLRMDIEEKVANASEAELVAMNTRAMKHLHAVWAEATKRLDDRAGDSRLCDAAIASGGSREIECLLHMLHAKMDTFAAVQGDIPMPRAGDR